MSGVVVVTGAARGIGRAVCERLRDEHEIVVAVDIDEAALAEAARSFGSDCISLVGDIAAWSTHEAAAAAARRAGELVGWVNNAGIDVAGAAHEVSEDELRRALDVLQLGPMFGCCVAVREMLPRRRGSIVNISSIQGAFAFPRYYAYQAAKAAVAMISKGIAADYGPFGIRCNAVLPGSIDTAMGRIGQPAEIAEVVAFLLYERASYLTGAAIAVDGGATARCYAYPTIAVPDP